MRVGNPGKKMSSLTPGKRPWTNWSRVIGKGMDGSSEHLYERSKEGGVVREGMGGGERKGGKREGKEKREEGRGELGE